MEHTQHMAQGEHFGPDSSYYGEGWHTRQQSYPTRQVDYYHGNNVPTHDYHGHKTLPKPRKRSNNHANNNVPAHQSGGKLQDTPN